MAKSSGVPWREVTVSYRYPIGGFPASHVSVLKEKRVPVNQDRAFGPREPVLPMPEGFRPSITDEQLSEVALRSKAAHHVELKKSLLAFVDWLDGSQHLLIGDSEKAGRLVYERTHEDLVRHFLASREQSHG